MMGNPTADELHRLYWVERLSEQAIADRLGVSRTTVRNYLKRAGVPTRPRKTAISRADLEGWIAEGLSLPQMGRRVGLTGGAVAIRMRQEGLRAPVDGRSTRERRGRRERLRFSGYWMLHRPDHPRADKRGYVMEHRLLMEEALGRFLEPDEVVHHMNHVRDDNRLENLMLLPNQAAHMAEHQRHRRSG